MGFCLLLLEKTCAWPCIGARALCHTHSNLFSRSSPNRICHNLSHAKILNVYIHNTHRHSKHFPIRVHVQIKYSKWTVPAHWQILWKNHPGEILFVKRNQMDFLKLSSVCFFAWVENQFYVCTKMIGSTWPKSHLLCERHVLVLFGLDASNLKPQPTHHPSQMHNTKKTSRNLIARVHCMTIRWSASLLELREREPNRLTTQQEVPT